MGGSALCLHLGTKEMTTTGSKSLSCALVLARDGGFGVIATSDEIFLNIYTHSFIVLISILEY
jgi:hypothetical protein